MFAIGLFLLAQDQSIVSVGISVEQYRPRIGSHDNFVKTKDVFARFRDHFWNMMIMMFNLNVFHSANLETSCWTIQIVE